MSDVWRAPDGRLFWDGDLGRPVRWIEYRLPRHMRGDEVRRELLRFAGNFRSAHCFNDEPWHPDAWIARVTFVEDNRMRSWQDPPPPSREWSLAESSVPFDADADAIGPYGLSVLDSTLRYAPDGDQQRLRKLIHCVLNQAGYTRRGEVAWALDYAWRSAAMLVLEPLQRHRPALASRAAGLLRRVPGPRGLA